MIYCINVFTILPFSSSHGEKSRLLVILHYFCVTEVMPALYTRFANPSYVGPRLSSLSDPYSGCQPNAGMLCGFVGCQDMSKQVDINTRIAR